ncbi:MAG: hypothetical protein WA001_00135 [Patescibacteria group bacterium]
MKEIFAPTPGSSVEREPTVADVKKTIEQGLEQVESTRALLIDVAQMLDEKIPHNDVLYENKTIPFHVIRNVQLSRIDELDTREAELHALRTELDQLDAAA